MSVTANPEEGKRAFDLDRKYVFHSWSAQATLNPMVIAGAEGSYIWDYDGNRLLDFSSQLVYTNLGHQHPKIVAAIQEQVGRLATVAPQHAVAVRGEAAKRIIDVSNDNFTQVFFTGGGAEAVENAIRMARLHTGRRKVLSQYRSYHGNTSTAIAATGDSRRWPNEIAPDHVHFFGPFLYRSVFHATTQEEECQRALEYLEQTILLQGPATIAAILMETVVGTAGIIPPPPGYLNGGRDLCDKHGIVMICDEVMAGFGRTGKWFAYQNYDVSPDLVTFAKGVNSGYIPVGGVIISEKIVASFQDRVFPGGLTYSGHPVAMASICAAIDAMHEEGTMEHATTIGQDALGPALRGLAERHPIVGDVRGLGVFWGLDLVKNRDTREPALPYAAPLSFNGGDNAVAKAFAEAKKRGLLLFPAGNRLHVVPPCNVSASEVEAAMVILDEALTVADQYVS